MENLQSIFSDPMYSMMASRSGLHPETYWQTLHPKAKEQHLSRVGAPPATYVTEEQYANSQAVGANSGPNAFLSNSPVLAGYDGNPMQPGYPGSGPRADAAPVLSSVTDADVARDAPGALSTMDQGQLPGPGTANTYVPPANDLTAAALLKKQEGVLATENVGKRQKLETMIRDLQEGITSSDDLPRLEQLKAKLAELGGPTSENVSTPQYDTAAQDYARQLEDAQVMAVEARPTVNAARTEIQNLLPLMDDPTVSEVIKAGVQSRIEDAQAVIAQSEADADAIRGVPAGAPGYTQPSSMVMPEQQVQPVLSANSNPEQNMANFRPAPGGAPAPVLEDPTAEPKAAAAVLNQSNSVGGGSGGGNRTTGSTTQSTSRSVSPSTGNARGSQMGYGKANNAEMLMRVGGAMYSGSLQGDGIGAATREYGSIQDDRRAADTAAYEAQEKKDAAKRLADAKVRAASAKVGAKGSSKAQAAANHAAIKLRDVDAALKGLDDYDGVVGMGYWFNKGWDLLTDGERSTIRQKIARVKVDATLSNTAFTKGAISDREMKIFQSDQPSWMAGENAWRNYLNSYRDALLIMNSNLASGATPYAASNKSGVGSSGGSTDYSAADALVGI